VSVCRFPGLWARLSKLSLRRSERKVLLVSVDLALVIGAILLSLRLGALRSGWAFTPRFLLTHVYWFPFLAGLWFLLASVNDLYHLKALANLPSAILTNGQIAAQVLLIYIVVYFLSPPQSLPRHIMIFFTLISFPLVSGWRVLATGLLRSLLFRRRALILGAGAAGETILQAIQETLAGHYELIGFIDDSSQLGEVAGSLPMIGRQEDLLSVVGSRGVSEVILSPGRELDEGIFQAIMECQARGVQITPMPLLYEELTGRVPVDQVGGYWGLALPFDHAGTGGLFPLLKRGLDITLASAGLVLFALLFPFIALALYLDSPGPIFYLQERVGQGGSAFRLIKLRTMIPNAESRGEALWAELGDPRVTRVGWFLRRTHLDEMPQLINVLRGDMSMVGPRPERPEFVAQLERKVPFYHLRHAVRPGMAGWALIKQGYASSVMDAQVKLEYDLYYIKHQSLSLDLLILFRSLGAILLLQGR